MLPAGRAFSAFQPFGADSVDAHQGGAEAFGGSAGAAMCVPVESGGDKGGACGSQRGACGDACGRPCPQNPPGGAGPAGMQACGGGQDPAVGMQWTAIQSPVPSRHDRGGIANTASRGQVDCNIDLYMQDNDWGGNDILSGDTVLVHSPNRDNEADDENDGHGIGSQADEGTEPHGVHSTQEGCNGSQEPLSSQRETTQLDADGSQGAARTRKRGDWAHLDTMTLICAKGERYVARAINSEDMGNGRTSKQAWVEIANTLTAAGFKKTWLECRTRWRNIWSTYRQVTTLHRGSGAQSYWRITSAERNDKGFNFILRKDWFDLLEVFYWNDKSVHPSNCEDPGSRFEEGQSCPPGGASGGGAASPDSAPAEGAPAAASDSAPTQGASAATSDIAPAQGAGNSDPPPSYKRARTAQNARKKSFKELGSWMQAQTGALKHHTDTTLKCAELTVSAIDRQSSTAAAVQRDCAQLIAQKMEYGWKVIADLVRESHLARGNCTSRPATGEFPPTDHGTATTSCSQGTEEFRGAARRAS
ncbi:hypothetical protein CBR_g49367 [Chara braunii]|uniref:Myb-like domain-containing protein n=1 Tax=Chara braunii TaxID=69332 RepID=A0A388M4S1_CHABU|nr:hypothetical protein CBR_g49367 [Chara braunii]|eukprot:GBG89578.1 hypothetical protein CBR_g49367 [Chara braunii]